MRPAPVPRWLAWYYLATPVFAVADLGLGHPLRVAPLVPEEGRMVWYAVAFGLGVLCRTRPAAAPWTGMLESAANLTVLLLSILLPIWSFPLADPSAGPVQVGLTPEGAVNALLSGTAIIASFHRSEAAALGRRGGGGLI